MNLKSISKNFIKFFHFTLVMKTDIVIVDNIKIKRKTIFDLARFYKFIKYWMDDNGFFIGEGPFNEYRYIDKTEARGKHLEIFWEGEKAFSDYFIHKMKISFLVLGLTEVEIQKGAKKLKLDSADVEIRITGALITDAKNSYKDSPFSKIIQKIYENIIIKKRMDEYKRLVYEKTYSLQDEIKKFLDMYRF